MTDAELDIIQTWVDKVGDGNTALEKDLADDVDRLVAEVRRLRRVEMVALGLQGEMDAVIAHAERRGVGGQQVPFHGHFAAVANMPSTINRFRWWSKQIGEAMR